MAYIGSTPTSQNFISGTDYFNGTGSQTAFTLTRSVNSVNDVEVVVNNVIQQPNSYTVSGTTLTLSAAPSSGTSNVYVRYLSTTQQSLTVGNNTVGYNQLTTDMQSKFAMKNRIINGAMVINQRGFSGTITTDQTYTLDRMCARQSAASKYSVSQSSTAPAGFVNSLLVTSLSAYSLGSTDFFGIQHSIEGYNTADLGWGTANGKTVTLSFWVQSSLTGTFGGQVFNSAASVTSGYTFSYTITTANTWQQISVTIPAPPNGTTWGTTNSYGIVVWFNLGTGSSFTGTPNSWITSFQGGPTGGTNLVGTNGATFYITGVQLEVGSSATGFEYRQYQQELALCQRYFQKTNTGLAAGNGGLNGTYFATTNGGVGYQFPVTLRATPTVTRSSSNNTFYVSNVDGASPGTTSGAVISTTGYWTQLSSMTSAAIGYPIFYNGSLSIEAEL